MTGHPIDISSPSSPADWNVARMLVVEYVASLTVDLAFQGIDGELNRFATEYGPPSGAFLIARMDDLPAGCVGLRSLTAETCEMKRLYIRPAARGAGVGRSLAQAIIGEARRRNFQRMVLDTLPDMHAAQALYRALGFVPIAPYCFNPVPGTMFMSLELR